MSYRIEIWFINIFRCVIKRLLTEKNHLLKGLFSNIHYLFIE